MAVTGTRGKSSVTRLVAGALRESGRRVVAKTTGSAASLILPDASEREIPRPGPATILETASLVRLAARLRAEALVAEMMSISPECLGVESRKLLRPGYLLLTNVRLDHLDEQGATREEIARSLSRAIAPGSTALVPEEDSFPVFEARAALVGAHLVKVPKERNRPRAAGVMIPGEFEENVRLALATTDLLGIPRPVALRGMSKAKPDPGRLKAVRVRIGAPAADWLLVSAFAANEPESSRRAIDRLRGRADTQGTRRLAVLNLRTDRGDRTRQWLTALESGFFSDFDGLFLVGSPAVHPLRRRLRRLAGGPGIPERLLVLGERSPAAVTYRITSSVPGSKPGGGLVVGLGNMGGLGVRLMEHWDRIGVPAEVEIG